MPNFLERQALKRAGTGLAHLMAPGEAIEEFDIAEDGRGGRVDVVLSDQALYLIPFGRTQDAMRLDLGQITRVVHGQPLLEHLLTVETDDGSRLDLYAKRKWRALPERLAARVPRASDSTE